MTWIARAIADERGVSSTGARRTVSLRSCQDGPDADGIGGTNLTSRAQLIGWLAVLSSLAWGAALAAAADQRGKPPSTLVAKTPPAVAVVVKPNLSVGSVWLGAGSGDRFAPLGHAPRLGETVSLVCRVNVTSKAPSGWKMAWYVDGVKTCGEGKFAVIQHDCEFPWPFDFGTEVFIDYVPHQTGSHTFRCAVDIGADVAESSELDNAKQVSFNVVLGLQKVPDEKIPITRAPAGPRLRRVP